MKETSITKLSEFVSILEGLEGAHGNHFWFRGHSDASYVLKPSLYRNPLYPDIADIVDVEQKIYSAFTFMSPSFVEKQSFNAWDQLFLMQHHRVPTRLLDWSMNPFAGLFFALYNAKEGRDASVSILDPIEWNRGILSDINGQPRIYSTNEKILEPYHPKHTAGDRRSQPLAIDGVRNNARINAQKGTFVVFGHSNRSMEEFFADKGDVWNDNALQKVRIPSAHTGDLRKILLRSGVTPTSMFPDLEGLSDELRDQFQF
jgi:hypothetical protein